jgi:YVTN family beta-propeller protein
MLRSSHSRPRAVSRSATALSLLALSIGSAQAIASDPSAAPPRSRPSQVDAAPAGPVVNAPVAPDAIYVARTDANPSLSVVDLNGFGQGTGNPTFDFTYQTFAQGNSNFPNNPNVKFQGGFLFPPLVPGTSTLDGGSEGVFTLTRDSNLQDRLITAPQIGMISDLAIGQPLDLVFQDGLEPSGCQGGGGNLCAISGLKQIDALFSEDFKSVVPANVPGASGLPANSVTGAGNSISWAPHPNPPALIYPWLCVKPRIGGQEPTSFLSIAPPPEGVGLTNLLAPGDPFGDPTNGIPPTGLLARRQNAWFEGPDHEGLTIASCLPHMVRQQIGHFLYLADRLNGEVVVLNSNRMQVLERIAVPDPVEFAMGPNLDLLAVTSGATDAVHFIDIKPGSSRFHRVVRVVPVGNAPRGIAWDPGNEDVLVCNEQGGSVSIISVATLSVRKTVTGFLDLPFDVAITQRQDEFGTFRDVYFAWILNRSGKLALFESGPGGPNGWGYDDVIGVAPMNFDQPLHIAPDFEHLEGGVWIAHRTPLDANGQPTGMSGGALTNARIVSSVIGVLPLTMANFATPQFRDMAIAVDRSIDEKSLTGIPVDLAQDDQVNLGLLPNHASEFGSGIPAATNGKSLVRRVGERIAPAKTPSYLLVAIPNSTQGGGVIDVIDLATKRRIDTNRFVPGVQSIPAPGATALADYWRP